MISASVPLLRPIFKRAIRKTQASQSYELNHYGNRSGVKGYALSSGNGTGSNRFARDRDIEASSEEGILPMKGVEGANNKGMIVKTTNVDIVYEEEAVGAKKEEGGKTWGM